ncbi:hypothetical protein [Paenibacillus sp. NPDC058174]|uniref:hypothetical protein n=1 Tax=Paenibacillus sp. NPDC058174 TaxID=3346366 RepID=UPI0036DB6AD2
MLKKTLSTENGDEIVKVRGLLIGLAILLAVNVVWPGDWKRIAWAQVGPSIEMTEFAEWPDDLQLNYSAFANGVSDGHHIWMIPQEVNQVVKLDPATGTMTGYGNWPSGFTKGNGAFSQGIFVNQSIWMIPSLASSVIQLDTVSGTMTKHNNWPSTLTVSSSAFSGGIYDGRFIWMVPSTANQVVRVDPTTGEMTGYDDWPDDFTLTNMLFPAACMTAGTYGWCLVQPTKSSGLIR